MNKISVSGKLVKVPYMGTGKAGPYASVNLEVPDGKYHFWLGVYAPGAAAAAFGTAKAGDVFEVEGSLTETKRGEQRVIQVKAERVKKVGPAASYVDRTIADVSTLGITDDDIPF